MPTVLLIRHAQASFGAVDYDLLSERGHQQVGALVAGLERRGIVADLVIAGGLRRQRETAAPCAAAVGRQVGIDERWNEYDDRDILTNYATASTGLERQAGDDVLSADEFQQILNRALRQWIDAREASGCREPWPQFRERLLAALQDLTRELGKGETALVVSSGGAIAAITATLLGLPPDATIAFNHVSVNTAITKLAVGRGGTTLISSNEHAHLEEADASLISYR